jgi:Aluminium activated malate transporter
MEPFVSPSDTRCPSLDAYCSSPADQALTPNEHTIGPCVSKIRLSADGWCRLCSYVIFTAVVVLSERVEATVQKGFFRFVGTVIGGRQHQIRRSSTSHENVQLMFSHIAHVSALS